MKYLPLFILIQLINLPLMIAGWVLCLLPSGSVPWLWQNPDSDVAAMTYWQRYVYEAWRNPVSNLRSVPGVFGKGRPLWYWSNQKYYAKAGWESDGYLCLSAGSGRGY